MDGDDAWVLELSGGPALPKEALNGILLPHQVGRQDLDGDIALQGLMASLVDGPYLTPADLGDDLILTERPADKLFHDRSAGH